MTNAIARCLAVVLALLPAVAAGEPIKLKMAYFASDREPPYVSVLQPFADAVNREANGVVEIVPYAGGVLGRSYSQQVQQVQDGVADMAWVNPSLTPDRFPDNDVLEFPGRFRDLREATLVFSRMVAAGVLRGYGDFFVISAVSNLNLMIHTRLPLETLSDLQGKKLRVSTQVEGSGLRTIGATPVILPVNEIALAIGRGTLDGAILPPNTLVAYGVSRITRFHYDVPLGATPLTFLMNRQKFDSLPKSAQDVIRKHSGEATTARFIETYNTNNLEATNELKSDPNRHVIAPSQSELGALRTTFAVSAEQWRNQRPRNMELWKRVDEEVAKVRSAE